MYLSRKGNIGKEVKRTQKLLVTGASGLLGDWTVRLAESKYNVTPTDIIKPTHPNAVEADLTDSAGVHRLFSKVRPDIVIHAASETNVDRCETEKDRAWKINVEGTKNVAQQCQLIGAKLIYISTDYVFGGEKGLYNEEDLPNPVDFYGLTKLEGEKNSKRVSENCAVLRTSVLYGRHPWKQDFATWVINKLKQNQEISVVNDHFNTPTLAENLSCIALEVATSDLKGIFHTSGCERISRYDFAKRIAQAFKLDSSFIKPISMKELKAWTAKRPRDSSLDTTKIQKQLRTKPLNINEGLSKLKEEMKT